MIGETDVESRALDATNAQPGHMVLIENNANAHHSVKLARSY